MKLLATVCFIALAACGPDPSALVIRDPCADFATNFAPNPGPKLVRGDGQLLLEVPFTPAAGHKEVELMEEAAKHAPAVVRVASTGREFTIQGPASGGITVYVATAEHAEAILRDLCYEGDKAKVALP